MLIMGRNRENILMCQDTVIFLLQYLGFVINLQKSQLEPNAKMKFLAATTYLYLDNDLERSRSQVKLSEMFLEKVTTLRELASLIGKLISTYQAVLPAPLNCRSLQMYQITKLKENLSYKVTITRNSASLEELKWWCNNLIFNKGIQKDYKDSESGRYYSVRYGKTRGMGSSLPGINSGRWSVDKGRNPDSFTCFRTKISEVGNRILCQSENPEIKSHASRQHECLFILSEKG